MRRSSTLIAIALGCSSIVSPATAATFNWTNNSGGTYNVATNWTPNGNPGGADTVQFGINSTYTVAFNTAAVANILTVDRGDVTFDLNTATFRTNSLTSSSMGNTAHTATLRITDGAFRPGNLTMGVIAGATSNLILDTASDTTIGSGPLLIGQSGNANLTLQNGAVLTSSGAGLGINVGGVGNATIVGTGAVSKWTIGNAPLRIGSNGTGAVDIQTNGEVSAFGLEIGENLNSVGTLSVGGLASKFTTDGLANIGGASPTATAASATLNVANGAVVSLNGETNLRTNAQVNVTGGTLNLNTVNVATGADVDWQAGTINFANGSTLTTGLLDKLLAGTSTLGANRTLSATAGTIDLASTLIVSGGRIAAPTINLNADMDISGFSNIAAGATMTIGVGRTLQLRDFSTLGAATSITNSGGTVVLNGRFVNVTGPFINNGGYVRGVGRFSGGLNNGAAGTLRLEAGDHIIIDQTNRTNGGTIELAGGTIDYSQSLINQAGGVITGRGVFRGSSATPGGTGLTNQGVMSFSAGITDIFGDVDNTGAGKIIAAGGSIVTFYDDVVHNGSEIRTNSGSRSVFFGSVTGAGPFTGGGDVEFNGDLKPGNSPANLSFAGDVAVNTTAGLAIELGGIAKGAGYDALSIAGAASLSGLLDVSLINGFIPSPGQTFEIITALGGISGTFDFEQLPTLGGGLHFDVRYEPNAVLLAVASSAGDYNDDGNVDAADYVFLRKTLPQSAYADWRTQFGEAAAATAHSATNLFVPEPNSFVLIATSLLPLHCRRKRSTPLAQV
jgi:hypothetical protein